ncbi:carbon-nitrogen hydrolase family protein, partial [Candidatus Sumerlaeota bacterium]|nr:carbon-nitrogen hydrolase family protein [Candidatus Sumerlaeota bacterium]
MKAVFADAYYFVAIAVIAVLLVHSSTQAGTPAESSDHLKVASIQMAISDDVDANLARILRGIDEAAQAGARVVIFPETALSGFNKDTIEKMDWNRLQEKRDAIAARAKERNIYVLYGSATPSGEPRPFNSAILTGPDGREIMRYHKMAPEAWFQPGDHLALFEIDGVKCTVMICHDERMPEITRLPVLSGAVVCFYISYEINSIESALRKAEGYRAQLIARATENGIWICQANGIGPLGESENKSLGQSRFVDPGGKVIAEAPALVDTMLVEEIDP